MTGSGTDHQVGINHVCPGCGAKSGGLIPKSHYLGCPEAHTVSEDAAEADQ